jgi:hypothetical protein
MFFMKYNILFTKRAQIKIYILRESFYTNRKFSIKFNFEYYYDSMIIISERK